MLLPEEKGIIHRNRKKISVFETDLSVPEARNRRGCVPDLVYPLHTTTASLSGEGERIGTKITFQP